MSQYNSFYNFCYLNYSIIFLLLIFPLTVHSQVTDWSGTYYGTLPCSDCEGVQTEITLNKNKTYDLITRRIGKGDLGVKAISGNFSISKEGNIITLGGIKKDVQPVQYRLADSTLTQLDMEGKNVTGDQADKYILKKGRSSIEEKYWKLVTLYGSTVAAETGDRKEPHIMLKAEGQRLTGASNCNSFSGDYRLNGENGITITKVIATKTACPVMDSEALFLKALEFVDGYTISGDTLQIHKAKATPVARFVAVYKKH